MTRSSFLKMAIGAAVAPKVVDSATKFITLPAVFEFPKFINRPEYDYYVACVWGKDEKSCWIGLSSLSGKEPIEWMEINKPATSIPSLESGIFLYKEHIVKCDGPPVYQKMMSRL